MPNPEYVYVYYMKTFLVYCFAFYVDSTGWLLSLTL